jgi:hypothetical protein
MEFFNIVTMYKLRSLEYAKEAMTEGSVGVTERPLTIDDMKQQAADKDPKYVGDEGFNLWLRDKSAEQASKSEKPVTRWGRVKNWFRRLVVRPHPSEKVFTDEDMAVLNGEKPMQMNSPQDDDIPTMEEVLNGAASKQKLPPNS